MQSPSGVASYLEQARTMDDNLSLTKLQSNLTDEVCVVAVLVALVVVAVTDRQ